MAWLDVVLTLIQQSWALSFWCDNSSLKTCHIFPIVVVYYETCNFKLVSFKIVTPKRRTHGENIDKKSDAGACQYVCNCTSWPQCILNLKSISKTSFSFGYQFLVKFPLCANQWMCSIKDFSKLNCVSEESVLYKKKWREKKPKFSWMYKLF